MNNKKYYNPLSRNGIDLDELIESCVLLHDDLEFHDQPKNYQLKHMHTDTNITPRDIYKNACQLVHDHKVIVKPFIKELNNCKQKVNTKNIKTIIKDVKKIISKLHYFGLAYSSVLKFPKLSWYKKRTEFISQFKAFIDIIILDIK